MADIEDPADRLNALVDQQDARIANIFRTAIASLKDDIDLDALADLLAQGRIDEALGSLQHAAEQLGSASNVAFITAGQSTSDFLAGAGVGRAAFDIVNTRAVAAMQTNRLELITEFTNEQRKATSLAITAGIESGINPRQQARNFRDSIGLTTKQWEAVANYRRTLEAVHTDPDAVANAVGRALTGKRDAKTIQTAARNAKPLTADQIDMMVQRYTNSYVKYRSEVIGRTEALRSVHQGNEEAYQQAIDRGDIDASKLTRTWRTRIDGRERLTHELLNGTSKPWGQPWQTKNGNIRFPRGSFGGCLRNSPMQMCST